MVIWGEGVDRGWDGWMASPTQWTWVWISSRSWWRTEKPGVLQSMGSQRVGHNWVTELNWVIQQYQTGEIRTSRKGCWNREEKKGWRKRESSQQPPCTTATLTHSHAVNFFLRLTISLQDIEVKFLQQRKKLNLEMFFYLIFSLVLLRNNWHTSPYKFKAYSVMVWLNILWNYYRNRFS